MSRQAVGLMVGVAGLLLTAVAGSGDRLALAAPDGELTYRELNDEANRLAHGLAELGVGRGDRVATVLDNGVDQVVAWHATQKIGAVLVPISVRLLADEVAAMLTAARARLVLTQRHSLAVVDAAAPSGVRIVVRGGPEVGAHVDWDALVARQGSHEATDTGVGGADGSLLLFTSGSTGAPKGVLRNHQMVRDYAVMMAAVNDNLRTPETLVTHCPLYHTAGMALLMKMVTLGGTLVLVRRFDAEAILDLVERHRATQVLLLPPVMYGRLLDAQRENPRDLTSVREAQSSGGVSTKASVAAMQELFPGAALRFSWGSTETCAPTSAALTADLLAERPELATTIGRRNLTVDIRLVDEHGDDVPDGTPGEAWVRSPMVFSGYLDDPERAASAFVDGWFRTGDLLRRDAEGYYYLVDRLKDMIKSGGENVYASELERLLAEVPGVRESAVVGLPDPRWGEAVAVAVVGDGSVPVTAEHLVAHCRARTASFRKPCYFALLDDLPRTGTGKVDKEALRSQGRALFTPVPHGRDERPQHGGE